MLRQNLCSHKRSGDRETLREKSERAVRFFVTNAKNGFSEKPRNEEEKTTFPDFSAPIRFSRADGCSWFQMFLRNIFWCFLATFLTAVIFRSSACCLFAMWQRHLASPPCDFGWEHKVKNN